MADNNRGMSRLTLVGVVLGLMVMSSLVFNFWLAPMIFTQNKQAGEQLARDTMASEKALDNYRWFREQWHDIQAQRAQLQNYKDQRARLLETYGNDSSEWPSDVRERHARISDRITGTQNMLENMIAEYNARSEDSTRAIFACGLPYNVDEKLFIADATGVEYTSEQAATYNPPENPENCKYLNGSVEAPQ